MKLTKEFQSRLSGLKTSGRKAQYIQACMILTELGTGMAVSKKFRPDDRIPNSLKYELPDGHRIVFQRIEGSDEYLALFVGTHDEVDHYLNEHKGWIVDPIKHNMRELRLNTATEDINNVVRSPELKRATAIQEVVLPSVFSGLTDAQLENAGVPLDQFQACRALSDPDSIETTLFLDLVPQAAADILLSYLTGSQVERAEIEALLSKQRELVATLTNSELVAIENDTDQFVDLRDLPSEKLAFEELPFEDWMLYLHPDQKIFVNRTFTGPARLRGVSGSGKTVVAIHRAREGARRNIRNQSNSKVLFITFNRSLAELVRRLLRRLCTKQEYDMIEVSTHGHWCQDYLRFRTGGPMRWDDKTASRIWVDIVTKHLPRLHQAGLCLAVASREQVLSRENDIQFLSDEVDFIYGKFVHSESRKYLTVERVGRGRPLGPQQRLLILSIYEQLVEGLAKAKHFDAREMPRLAFQLLSQGTNEAPKANYSDIIVDEVQDLTDMELRVLHAIEQVSGQLFLVGDGAQQIMRRSQSLKSIGISVSGRSFILRKNYRNTAEITAVAAALRNAEGIGRFDEDAAASQIAAIPSSVSGDRPCLLICQDSEQERALVLREIKYLTNRLKIDPSHICCLARNMSTRSTLLAMLKAGEVAARDYRAEGLEGEGILVSTLHNSKGHEFRAVFILGLNEGTVPMLRSDEPEELESEAALLYVAITRAKELLYLSTPRRSAGKAQQPSRFIADLKDTVDVLDFVD
jgi:superfamily I DNA/RNA helicase